MKNKINDIYGIRGAFGQRDTSRLKQYIDVNSGLTYMPEFMRQTLTQIWASIGRQVWNNFGTQISSNIG